MNIIEHQIFNEVKIIENFCAFDLRGSFIKIYNEDTFREMGIDSTTRETYYSISKKDTIRGMHFQQPPMDHDKIVHVVRGDVVDVIVDLRKSSSNYKRAISIHLSGNRPRSIYIPKGFAHGFKCLENDTIMLYNCSTVYSPEHDRGIRYDSIDYDWELADPIISDRDLSFPTLQEFESPFE